MTATFLPPAPRVFVSYSHDSREHKEWVLALSDRLVKNGVDIILDQWDARLGTDLPLFMEKGLTGANRVLAICTSAYVTKANDAKGGVGYEKMILSAALMKDVSTNQVIPVLRNNTLDDVLPTFLGSRIYIDFRNENEYEEKYTDLLRELHGEYIRARPKLGPNPFARDREFIKLADLPERYCNPQTLGYVTFNFKDNNGRFRIGSGEMAFDTTWSAAGMNSMWAYNSENVPFIALAEGAKEFSQITDATKYNYSSRTRDPKIGEIVVWHNKAGYYAATKLEAVSYREKSGGKDEIVFSFAIQPN